MIVSLNQIRVLHVDDDADFAEMVANFLEQEDRRFAVEIVTSATDGLNQLERHNFDCVVSDYAMPEQTGIEFLSAIRDKYPDLPFILYTGKGSEETASDAISGGVTDYFRKETDPSHYTILANRIENAVKNYYTQIKLADREQRLTLFFEQSPLGIIEWNTEFEIVQLNSAAEEILGYDANDLVGSSWEQIVPESDHETVADIASNLLENDGGYRNTNKNIRGDDEQIICEWHNRTVTDDDGDVIAVFSQFQDITERKEYEKELKRQNERLDQFAGVVSHDLRNPLQVAEGRRELIEMEYDSEHLDAMARAHTRMEQLIDDLLTLAQEGRDETEQERVDLSELVRTCWQNVAIDNAEITVKTDLILEADQSRLAQLLENLLENATEHGGNNVRVTFGRADDGFYIADDGSGIPESNRERIFNTGYTTADDGTGFGLAIVTEIVEAHDWEIDVTESKVGGARFEITNIESIAEQE